MPRRRPGRRVGSLCRGAECLLLQVFLISLTTRWRAWSQGIDSTAPRLVTMSPIDRQADVWLFASPLRCTPSSCDSGPLCGNSDCTASARVRLSVQDLPVVSGGQEPAGIKAVSVRFASPTAQREGREASFDLDENIDLSLFSVGQLDFQPFQKVGMEPEGTALEVPVIFDGYSEAGDWALDSVALTDHMDNREVLDRDFLMDSGYFYSISVSSLELSTCSGTCGGAAVKCRQFGSPSVDSSQSLQQRIWWRCLSSDPSSSQQGACCATCSQTAVVPAGIIASCQSPAEALRLAPCGCAESGQGEGWACSKSRLAASLGVASMCAGASGPWCHPNSSRTAKDSCGASGEGQLIQTAGPTGSSEPNSAPNDPVGLVPIPGAANPDAGASGGSNSSNATAGLAQAVEDKQGEGSEAVEDQGDWWEVEVRRNDPASVLIGLACMVGLFAGFLCIYFENRLRRVFRPAQDSLEAQDAATSMAGVHQPDNGGWVGGIDEESGWGDDDDNRAAQRLRTRTLLAQEFGVGLGTRGRPVLNSRGGGGLSRAEATARLREMGFGPIDASQAFAAIGATDVNLAADWIISRAHGRQAGTLRGVGGRGSLDLGADLGQEARSWGPGDSVMSAAEARRHGRHIRRAGSLPTSAPPPMFSFEDSASGTRQGGTQGERGWGAVRGLVRDGSIRRSGGSLVAPPSVPVPSGQPKRSQSVKLPGVCDEGSECCVCMDAPIQVPVPRSKTIPVCPACRRGPLCLLRPHT